MPKKGNNLTITLFSPLFTPFPGPTQGKGKRQGNGTQGTTALSRKGKGRTCPFVLQHPAKLPLYRATALRRTQIVRPVLQQRPSLIQQQRLVVRRPPLVAFHVGKLPLDCIRPVPPTLPPNFPDLDEQ